MSPKQGYALSAITTDAVVIESSMHVMDRSGISLTDWARFAFCRARDLASPAANRYPDLAETTFRSGEAS